MTPSMKIGYIVGEVDTKTFTFVSDLERFPPRHEYILIPGVRERVGRELREVDVLAQVTRIANYSDILQERLSLDELESIISRYSGTAKVFGTATILGYLDEDDVRHPRSAAVPGQEIFVAPTEILERFFSMDIRGGIEIGGLVTRPEVSVKIDPNGFRRHVAVIAQTGAGKSYLVGLILERLLPMGATILVFDPNSDYVMMRRDREGNQTTIAKDMIIYRPPGVKGRRYSDEEIGGAEDYTIEFSALSPEEVADIVGISDRWTRLRDALEKAMKSLAGIYYPEQLVAALEDLAGDEERKGLAESAKRALTYVKRLLDYQIWGSKGIPIEDLVKPRRMSIIDLAGLQRDVARYIVDKTLSELWSLAVTGILDYPVFVVLEEAHNFAPSERPCYIIDRIASEGRKFKIFLLIVTQRPNKISENVLSQCNSQIIMRLTNPEDISMVQRASERLSEDLLSDLPGLNRGEAVIVGELTKAPAMVKVMGRRGAEGGGDIDVVEVLKRASKAAEIQGEERLSTVEEIRRSKTQSEW